MMTLAMPLPSQERKRYPVCVSAGWTPQVARDIREGKTHCLVWAAGGLGWEQPQSATASSVPLTQQARLALADHPTLELLLSDKGGHVGFLARRPQAEADGWRDLDGRWAENRVVQAATQFLRMEG